MKVSSLKEQEMMQIDIINSEIRFYELLGDRAIQSIYRFSSSNPPVILQSQAKKQ